MSKKGYKQVQFEVAFVPELFWLIWVHFFFGNIFVHLEMFRYTWNHFCSFATIFQDLPRPLPTWTRKKPFIVSPRISFGHSHRYPITLFCITWLFYGCFHFFQGSFKTEKGKGPREILAILQGSKLCLNAPNHHSSFCAGSFLDDNLYHSVQIGLQENKLTLVLGTNFWHVFSYFFTFLTRYTVHTIKTSAKHWILINH